MPLSGETTQFDPTNADPFVIRDPNTMQKVSSEKNTQTQADVQKCPSRKSMMSLACRSAGCVSTRLLDPPILVFYNPPPIRRSDAMTCGDEVEKKKKKPKQRHALVVRNVKKSRSTAVASRRPGNIEAYMAGAHVLHGYH